MENKREMMNRKAEAKALYDSWLSKRPAVPFHPLWIIEVVGGGRVEISVSVDGRITIESEEISDSGACLLRDILTAAYPPEDDPEEEKEDA